MVDQRLNEKIDFSTKKDTLLLIKVCTKECCFKNIVKNSDDEKNENVWIYVARRYEKSCFVIGVIDMFLLQC